MFKLNCNNLNPFNVKFRSIGRYLSRLLRCYFYFYNFFRCFFFNFLNIFLSRDFYLVKFIDEVMNSYIDRFTWMHLFTYRSYYFMYVQIIIFLKLSKHTLYLIHTIFFLSVNIVCFTCVPNTMLLVQHSSSSKPDIYLFVFILKIILEEITLSKKCIICASITDTKCIFWSLKSLSIKMCLDQKYFN